MQLQPSGVGLEVSPYFDPFLSKSDYNILYTDYIGTEEIRAKAADNPDLRNRNVPAVDFIWTPGAPLAQCAPDGMLFDYVVASHVMEHVPNPIGWLNEILSVVKIGGRVALFLPDRRANADYLRQETQFHHLAQWWMEQPSTPTPGQVLDFMVHSFALRHGMVVDWDARGGPVGLERAYSDAEALSTSTFVHNEGAYIDVHCTVWNAETFKAIFQQVVAAGLLNVAIGNVTPENAEFSIVLTKLGEPFLKPPAKHLVLRGGAAIPSPSLPEPESRLANELEDLKSGFKAMREELAALARQVSAATAATTARSVDEFEHLKHGLGVVQHDLAFLTQQVAAAPPPPPPPPQSSPAEFEHLKHMLSVVHHDLGFLAHQVSAPSPLELGQEFQHLNHVLGVLQHDMALVAQQVSSPAAAPDTTGEFEHLNHVLGVVQHDLAFLAHQTAESAATPAAITQDIEHLKHALGVVLHDLTFLTQLVDASTAEVRDLLASRRAGAEFRRKTRTLLGGEA